MSKTLQEGGDSSPQVGNTVDYFLHFAPR